MIAKVKTLAEQLDEIGPMGSLVRLKAIAGMDLGERSEAAKRVVKKREARIRKANKLRFF